MGYTAVRGVELSAERGRGKAMECLCEIVESADSLSPVFRQGSLEPTAFIMSSIAGAPWACQVRCRRDYSC